MPLLNGMSMKVTLPHISPLLAVKALFPLKFLPQYQNSKNPPELQDVTVKTQSRPLSEQQRKYEAAFPGPAYPHPNTGPSTNYTSFFKSRPSKLDKGKGHTRDPEPLFSMKEDPLDEDLEEDTDMPSPLANAAAEWYFRRDHFESHMLNADDFGISLEDETSGTESTDNDSSSSDNESDYEEFRKKKKQCEKKKREEKKSAASKDPSKERQKFGGTEEEVASMIRKLNAMKLDDPEYAPM
ncbi:hypothetical protein C8J57DRAFT_1535079 [Mycena rebaudengoi]|nr:hypothetical protein C8J57DRAFT_1535079 [Mycena rebaudengoi]